MVFYQAAQKKPWMKKITATAKKMSITSDT